MECLSLGRSSSLLFEKLREPLAKLDVSGNPIGNFGLQQVLEGLGSSNGLKELHLNRTNPFFHASQNFSSCINTIVQNKGQNLQLIDLSNNLLGDQAAIYILQSCYSLQNLKSLSL